MAAAPVANRPANLEANGYVPPEVVFPEAAQFFRVSDADPTVPVVFNIKTGKFSIKVPRAIGTAGTLTACGDSAEALQARVMRDKAVQERQKQQRNWNTAKAARNAATAKASATAARTSQAQGRTWSGFARGLVGRTRGGKRTSRKNRKSRKASRKY